MSETNEVRQAAVLQAATEFEANQTVATRDALLAAVRAARAPRFYAVGAKLFLFRNGSELELADCRSAAVAGALRDRLNLDLDAGWIPSLQP